MESTTPFFRSLSAREKEDYQKSVEKWTAHNIPIFKGKIGIDIDNHKNHQEIVQLCAKSFADTELVKKTGYEFYFAEPLIECGKEKKGNRSFDLLLYNESTHQAILISCKSSISDPKRVLTEFEEAKQLVKEKINYLANDCIGDELELDNIEYVLCVYEKDEQKIINTLEKQGKRSKTSNKYKPHDVILWIYRPRSDIIQIHENHSHKNTQLTEFLFTGAGQSNKGSRFDLPYCLTSHNYQILNMAVVGECYAKQQVKGEDDPKIISRDFLFQVLMRRISLGVPQIKKQEIIKRKMERVIKYGEKYGVLVTHSDSSFRLNCRGDHIKTVKKSLEEKFMTNWASERAREVAKEKAEEEMRKKIYKKTLSDFGT